MSRSGPRKIAIVSACMRRDGTPAFALNEVAVTQEEIENGIHVYLAEAQLLEDGYDEPFVHFPDDESPAFLHPNVRQQIASTTTTNHFSENRSCPALSS